MNSNNDESISDKQSTTREFRCEKKDNYKFKNVSLFTLLKVIRPKHSDIIICINGVDIRPTSETRNLAVFDVSKIRGHCREVFGETPEENDLYRLETTFVYNSLKAMSHYSKVSTELLSNSIFSDELEINFKVICKYPVQSIDVQEDYIVSDVHKATYN